MNYIEIDNLGNKHLSILLNYLEYACPPLPLGGDLLPNGAGLIISGGKADITGC